MGGGEWRKSVESKVLRIHTTEKRWDGETYNRQDEGYNDNNEKHMEHRATSV